MRVNLASSGRWISEGVVWYTPNIEAKNLDINEVMEWYVTGLVWNTKRLRGFYDSNWTVCGLRVFLCKKSRILSKKNRTLYLYITDLSIKIAKTAVQHGQIFIIKGLENRDSRAKKHVFVMSNSEIGA